MAVCLSIRRLQLLSRTISFMKADSEVYFNASSGLWSSIVWQADGSKLASQFSWRSDQEKEIWMDPFFAYTIHDNYAPIILVKQGSMARGMVLFMSWLNLACDVFSVWIRKKDHESIRSNSFISVVVLANQWSNWRERIKAAWQWWFIRRRAREKAIDLQPNHETRLKLWSRSYSRA